MPNKDDFALRRKGPIPTLLRGESREKKGIGEFINQKKMNLEPAKMG